MTGEEIKALRKRFGLTQEQFAARLGVTALTVSRLERGVHKKPSPLLARELARAVKRAKRAGLGA